MSLLRRSGRSSLQKWVQNPRLGSCHHVFLGLNAEASPSVCLRRATTGPAMLPAVSVAPGVPCFCWSLSEALASVTSLSSVVVSLLCFLLRLYLIIPLPFRNSTFLAHGWHSSLFFNMDLFFNIFSDFFFSIGFWYEEQLNPVYSVYISHWYFYHVLSF